MVLNKLRDMHINVENVQKFEKYMCGDLADFRICSPMFEKSRNQISSTSRVHYNYALHVKTLKVRKLQIIRCFGPNLSPKTKSLNPL